MAGLKMGASPWYCLRAQGSGQRHPDHEPDVDEFLRLAGIAEKKIPRVKPIEKRLVFLRRL